MFNRKKKSAAAPKEPRFKTIRDAYSITKEVKPWIGVALAAIFLVVWILGIALGAFAGHPVYAGFVGLPVAILAALFFFTRVAGRAAYASIEGQIGAAASVLMAIRKGWTTTPAVAVTRNQEMVHRSVGRPGIVLVGEGGPGARGLLIDEKKKTERFAPGVPIYEVLVGDHDGQVSLQKLQKHMRKYKKKLSANQLREVRNRLKAVGGMSMPIPKGPMPKNVKVPKR
ncbi:unannotated protein [freshwater metagenome]|uniref:Unannotated protein n=1 Tax=freshwater metagenome TaxID=449393 RepID=A0A6J6S2P2_9ZZZZ|nr:DUF4191 family protein [Actinomycetota bacterium]MSW26911.1 DUF4191 family protein [Actinomycetota bacterium]MSW34078.1 DUF4191 family protein [Actinomycetota bacterium]MSX30640.1 DUF4191 family protein [Actinomycetota bacterium]MSY50617.1 DUF4191 family protein [Actinomycetota bacterium]